MNKGLYLIQRQQPEFINDFPTGNICIGVTKEELAELEKELTEHEEIKTYMQQYEISDIEELRRVLHNNWVIRQKFKTDTANVSKALEIIKNIGILKPYETSGGQCWLETMCDATKISKETYDLLKEVLL